MLQLLISGVLCALAVLFAAYAPRDNRSPALVIAAVLSAVWFHYAAAWFCEPITIAGVLYRLGATSVTHEQTWAATDAAVSVIVIRMAGSRMWGLAIWACSIGMLCCHAAQAATQWLGQPLEYEAYKRGLDAAFLAQLAVLFLLGENGVRDRLSRGVRRLRVPRPARLAPHLEG